MLVLEGAAQPMTGAALWELDTSTVPGGYSFEAFRARFIRHLDAIPELRMKLADTALNLDTPVWVDDPHFDPDNHLHRIQLPGGSEHLAAFVADRLAECMDRDRPLWDLWVIERLDDSDPRIRGHIAVAHRFHHVLGDGVTGLEILERLTSRTPDAAAPAPRPGIGTQSGAAITLGGLRRFAGRPGYLAGTLLPQTVAGVRNLRRTRIAARDAGAFTAPRTPWNGNVTERRATAFTQLDLEEVRRVKAAFGVTINDLVQAMVAGALRRYLINRGALPDAPLIAAIPISTHDPNHPGRNQISSMDTSLCTDIADPALRLAEIAEVSRAAKKRASAVGLTLLQDWMQIAPGLLALMMRLYKLSGQAYRRPRYNVTISNVPGPQEQSYLMGAAVRARYAYGPMFHGCGLNISVMSLNGKLDVGLMSCPDLLPEVWELTDGLPAAFEELRAAAEATAPQDRRPQR
jgi:diacylglycerol O-acyltransferase